MIIIPADVDPNDVADAVATYVVDHCALTHRGYSSVSEQIRNRLGPSILKLAIAKDFKELPTTT